MALYLSAALSIVNRHALRHVQCAALCNAAMRTVEEVRRLRLEQVRAVYGTWANLNAALKMSPRDSTFSQITSGKTKKDMGSDMARRLDRLMGKEAGWMDTDPAFDEQLWPFGPDISPRAVADLPKDLLLEARGMLKVLIAQAQRGRGEGDGSDKQRPLAA